MTTRPKIEVSTDSQVFFKYQGFIWGGGGLTHLTLIESRPPSDEALLLVNSFPPGTILNGALTTFTAH